MPDNVTFGEAVGLIRRGATPRRIETAWQRKREHAFEEEYSLPQNTVRRLADHWGIPRVYNKQKRKK